ncbi:MAG: efflux transporter outer membrane subunit [Beijerinckiaceae bacterium]|nr:efflux transporter outer membrane subunit [Beijerinckiaceae bacterium]
MIGRFLSLVPGAAFPLLLAGCASMPPGGERAEFMDPPSMKSALQQAALKQAAAPETGWPQDEWWRQFKSPGLDRVMAIAFEENPGLRKAYARLGEAGAVAQVEGARLLPWADADNTFHTVRYAKHGVVAAYNPALGGTYRSSYTFNFASFRYEFDFWGKNRAAFDAALGEAAAQEAEFAEARLLLTTAIARAYIRGVVLSQQLGLIHDTVKVARGLLDVARTRFQAGLGPADAVLQATLDLEIVAKVEANTRQLVVVQQNLLARLMGQGPDATENFFARERVSIPARISLPARLPIELLAHRPDLASAMHRAEAAAERIHVAKAQFLPSVDLSAATAGLEASALTKNFGTLTSLLFRASDLNFVAAPGFHLPLFEGGRLRGELSAMRSQYDEAVELYNDTLLHAVQEVADSLSSWKQTGAVLNAQENLLKASRGEVKLTQQRVRSGLVDRREILSVQRGLLDQQFALKASEADHLLAAIDVIQALGGGYSNGFERSRPQLAPEEALSGLEAKTPAWILGTIAPPLSPLVRN